MPLKSNTDMVLRIFSLINICTFLLLSVCKGQCISCNQIEKLNSNNSSFWNNSAQLTENITYPMAGVVVGTGIYQAFFAKKKDAFLLKQSLPSILVAAGTSLLIKNIVKAERPYEKCPGIETSISSDGYSFPSGHTTVASATATALCFKYPKWYVIVPATGYTAWVGCSRVVSGVHYPCDVLAGAAIGAASNILVFLINQKINKKQKSPKKGL